MTRVGTLLLLGSWHVLFFVGVACSDKREEISQDPKAKTPSPTPTPPAVTPTPAVDPTVAAGKTFWIAESDSYTIKEFNANNPTPQEPLDSIDLSVFGPTPLTGGITALTFLDAKTLIAYLDPGATGETIVAIKIEDKGTEKVRTPEKWYSDASYSGQFVTSIAPYVPLKTAADKITKLFVPNAAGFDKFDLPTMESPITLDRDPTIFGKLTELDNRATCPEGDIRGITMVKNSKGERAILLLSEYISDEKPGGIHSITASFEGGPKVRKCQASFSYTTTTSKTTTKEDKPRQAAFIPGLRKVFVLYNNPLRGDKIISYSIDATLSVAAPVFTVEGGLGVNFSSLVPYTNTSLILAGKGKVKIITTAGRDVRIYSGFPENLSAVAFYNPDIEKTPAPTPKPTPTPTETPD